MDEFKGLMKCEEGVEGSKVRNKVADRKEWIVCLFGWCDWYGVWQMMENVERLVKLHRWKPEKIELMNKFVKQSFEQVRHLPEGERMPSLQGMLDDYIGAMWGAHVARLRFVARRSRRYRQKKRADTKLARKTRFWNKTEDEKEYKVRSELARAVREEKGERFSFRRFVKEWREAKQKPLVIQDEATFEKYLEEQQQKMYIRGPSVVRQPRFPRAGYARRYRVEVLEPILYELKRKGYVTKLVMEREEAIKAKKVADELAERRAERALLKAERSAERQAYWNKVHSEWHKENDRLIALKREYFLARQDVYAQSRKEFLTAMNSDVHLWEESPEECKFLRFQFGVGVQFPFNNSRYL